jgi:hypothetical protein
MNQPPDFVVRLRPLPGNWRTEPAQRLRIALKVLLRAFGLRAVECRPVLPERILETSAAAHHPYHG